MFFVINQNEIEEFKRKYSACLNLREWKTAFKGEKELVSSYGSVTYSRYNLNKGLV